MISYPAGMCVEIKAAAKNEQKDIFELEPATSTICVCMKSEKDVLICARLEDSSIFTKKCLTHLSL